MDNRLIDTGRGAVFAGLSKFSKETQNCGSALNGKYCPLAQKLPQPMVQIKHTCELNASDL